MAKPVRKTVCPITREEFRENAEPIEMVLNGKTLRVPVKEFSTGSLGWYLNEKTTIKVGDKDVTVQLGLNFTIVGSKELPQDELATDAAAGAPPAPENPPPPA